MNNMRLRNGFCIVACLLFSGCFGLFDNGTDHIVDNYDVIWIDLHAHRSLCNTSEIVPAYIAAVGYNSKYLFVKQHPLTGEFDSKVLESVTNYYLIRRTKNNTQTQPIYGPLSEKDFNKLCDKLEIKDINFSTHYPENI